jgi:hypothetical protein
MELPLTEVEATNFGRPYKPGIYTPRLGLMSFQHITNITRPLMDSVNMAIRCPYSTLPVMGVFRKICKRKGIYKFCRFTTGLIYCRKVRSEKYERS